MKRSTSLVRTHGSARAALGSPSICSSKLATRQTLCLEGNLVFARGNFKAYIRKNEGGFISMLSSLWPKLGSSGKAQPPRYGIPSVSSQNFHPHPPSCPKEPHSFEMHGETVTDDYAWLQGEPDSPLISAYIDDENTYTEHMMTDTHYVQNKLYKEMAARVNPDSTVPERAKGYLYYIRYEEGENFPIYCRKLDGDPDAREEVLVNQNTEGNGYGYIGINQLTVSPNNMLLCYARDTTGQDNWGAYFKDLTTGFMLPDEIPRVVNVEWASDNKTLFYTVPDSLMRPHKLYRHILGTPVSKDVLVYEEPDDKFFVDISRTKDGKYMNINTTSKTTSEIRIVDAHKPDSPPRLVLRREEHTEYYLDHTGDNFFVITNEGDETCADYRIVRIPDSSNSFDKKHWVPVLSPSPGIRIEDTDLFRNILATYEKHQGLPQIRILNLLTNEQHMLPLPETICSLHPGGNRDYDTTKFVFSYSSPITPECTYEYDLETRELVVLRRHSVKGGIPYNPNDYICHRISATAEDGAHIPITLTHRKGIHQNSSNPLLLMGYGAYGVTTEPEFKSHHLPLLQRGWVLALAHVRGGGELGRQWYLQGRQLNKKNSFKDVIACAEHLVQQKYTSPELMAAKGVSAGGLLMGAVCNMRPELFRSVMMGVPFVDVVTAMCDPSLPLTIHEYDEWGNPSESKEVFKYIMSYDPYTNVSGKVKYPHLLVTGSTLDARVPFWQPVKYVAKLRQLKRDRLKQLLHKEEEKHNNTHNNNHNHNNTHKTEGLIEGNNHNTHNKKEEDNMVLLKVDTNTGHSGEGGRYNYLKEVAFGYAFLFKTLGLSVDNGESSSSERKKRERARVVVGSS